MPRILIYADEGADAGCVRETYRSFLMARTSLSSYRVQCVDAAYLNHASWENNTKLVVMPGGRSLPYYAKLAGGGNKKLSQFVAAGGHYWGICAGAYYASQLTEFEKGQPGEIICAGGLPFFQGIAAGPAYGAGLYDANSYRGARIASLIFADAEMRVVYFNGGPVFAVEQGKDIGVEVLARYHDLPQQPAAIVRCAFGKGTALLSGVHFEYSYRAIKSHWSGGTLLKQQLLAMERERQALFRQIFQFIL